MPKLMYKLITSKVYEFPKRNCSKRQHDQYYHTGLVQKYEESLNEKDCIPKIKIVTLQDIERYNKSYSMIINEIVVH